MVNDKVMIFRLHLLNVLMIYYNSYYGIHDLGSNYWWKSRIKRLEVRGDSSSDYWWNNRTKKWGRNDDYY